MTDATIEFKLAKHSMKREMIRRTKEANCKAAEVFTDEEFFTLKMYVSNPSIPRFYTLNNAQ